ncbi:hypothetical protein LINGRAHAP2_LOCUS7972 [Linum grandiflorum]
MTPKFKKYFRAPCGTTSSRRSWKWFLLRIGRAIGRE